MKGFPYLGPPFEEKMDFSNRKLPVEAAKELRNIPISGVRPFVPLFSPVYVYLPRNKKFLSVKGALDFFTPQDLTKLAPFESVFVHQDENETLPVRDAAHKVRSLLKLIEKDYEKEAWEGSDRYPPVKLPPAPFEISDAALRVIGPLWIKSGATGIAVDPLTLLVFVQELCDPLPGPLLTEASAKSVEAYERAYYRSSWAVFLALHLGYCEPKYLNNLRVRVFRETQAADYKNTVANETDELIAHAVRLISNGKIESVTPAMWAQKPSRITQKLDSRLRRVQGGLKYV